MYFPSCVLCQLLNAKKNSQDDKEVGTPCSIRALNSILVKCPVHEILQNRAVLGNVYCNAQPLTDHQSKDIKNRVIPVHNVSFINADIKHESIN